MFELLTELGSLDMGILRVLLRAFLAGMTHY